MSVILLMLGFVVAVVGLAAVLFGLPISELSLGSTLIIAGTTALTSGLILVGLSAVVTELSRIAEGLRTRVAARPAAAHSADAPEPEAPASVLLAPVPMATTGIRPPQATVPAPQRPRPEMPVREVRTPDPLPAPPSAVEVSAAAIERLRSSIPRTERPKAPSDVADAADATLSPNGGLHQPAPQQPALPETNVGADGHAGGAAGETVKTSRLDFLFRSKVAARPAPQAENFDAIWPADGRQARNAPAEPEPRTETIERRGEHVAAVQERRPEPATNEEPRTAILKSGVVDGMAYTLYADGSIEAKLPHGTVRFGSIAELRAHIEDNS